MRNSDSKCPQHDHEFGIHGTSSHSLIHGHVMYELLKYFVNFEKLHENGLPSVHGAVMNSQEAKYSYYKELFVRKSNSKCPRHGHNWSQSIHSYYKELFMRKSNFKLSMTRPRMSAFVAALWFS